MNLDAVIRALGSRKLSYWILVSGASYTLLLALLRAFSLIPPASYMVWSPLALWAVVFLVNLTISLLTQKYAFNGNLVFHISFLLVAAGIVTSVMYRFSGEVFLLERDTFFGEEERYITYSPRGSFDRLAPELSFRLDRIEPGYLGDELYFVRLDGGISYPAATLENRAVLTLNGGVRIGGTRLRITSFGIFPEVELAERGRLALKGPVRMMVFPPGMEDAIDLKGYRLYLKMFVDPEISDGKVVNRSMNLREPAFIVRVEWLGREIFRGAFKKDESLKLGDTTVTFTGVRQWIRVGVVKDPGENIVYAGMAMGVAGLLFRCLRHIINRRSRG